MPTFNNKERSEKKPSRWKEKVYSKQIIEYTNQSLRPDEKNVYDVIFNALVERYDLTEPNEIMLLDLAVNDFIRVKRLHLILKDESDIIDIKTRTGQVVRKAHEAGYLINAVETQFRQSMKELLLTPKSRIQKTIGLQPKNFTDAIGTILDGEFSDGDDKDVRRDVESRDDKTKKEETKSRDSTGGSEQPDRNDVKTKEIVK